MPKHEASVLMQARTECIKIAEFLFRRHVPDVPSLLYSCGHAPEILEHVLLRYSGTEDDKQEIRQKIAFIILRTRRNLAQLTFQNGYFGPGDFSYTTRHSDYRKSGKRRS
jgi:hypothetical protein